MPKELTGRHVLFGFVAAFGIIISVNLLLAYNAVKTFPGLEVKNSYVASQQFNERKAAQEALGWDVSASAEAGVLRLVMNGADGNPVYPTSMEAVLGRATQVKDDQVLEFTHDGTAFVAPVQLERGNWNIRMEAVAEDGTLYTQRLVLHVKK
ncbi:FixH family protein [Lentibacter sp. XHP0401]|jgi:nitrogen fixation protein FixH|uniref:FixH family protein n=1 Tax=Lentibacter sp. XHP0401 TaxID=2984334 RepID=UPI0021E88ABF|nr:FixH family protein [Lentibacter sp. XHP0401]MCV2893820.1 FixH family protein [Lentibacter sp. XHP0401]